MPIEQAYAAWLAFLASLGMTVPQHLNPPATPEQIQVVEAEIGFKLPDDLKQLYLRADGQKSTVDEADRLETGTVAPFFGEYDFVSLDQALNDYRVWKSLYDEAGANIDKEYDWATSREPDKVAARYWQPGWFPFAIDFGGNAYAVDLSPLPGGTYGQVIVIGRDEDERRVLAPSLAEFMQDTASRQPVILQREGKWVAFRMEPVTMNVIVR